MLQSTNRSEELSVVLSSCKSTEPFCQILLFSRFFFQIRGVKLSSFRKGGKKYKNTRSLCGEAEIDQKSCTRAKLYVLSSFRKGGKQVKKN
jgi:hypothetical protein